MQRRYQTLLFVCVIALAAAFMFAKFPRAPVLVALSYSMVTVPYAGLQLPFKWIFVPALIIGGWSVAKLRSLERQRGLANSPQFGGAAEPVTGGGLKLTDLGTLTAFIAFGALQVSAAVAVVGGWWTHILISAHAHQWALLIFGIVVPPLGVLHGWGHWIGWW